MKNLEKSALALAIISFGILVATFIFALSIVVVAGLAMLVCNVILPMFDVQYPITFVQGCGIGTIVAVIRMLFGKATIQVNK